MQFNLVKPPDQQLNACGSLSGVAARPLPSTLRPLHVVTLAMCTCAQPLPLAVVALFCTIPDRPQQTTEPDWEAERLHWGDSPESLNLKVRPSCQVRDQRIKVLREMKVEQAMVFGQCGRICGRWVQKQNSKHQLHGGDSCRPVSVPCRLVGGALLTKAFFS